MLLYETWARLAEIDPDSVSTSIGTLIAQLPGGKETLDGLKIAQETRAQRELQPFKVRAASREGVPSSIQEAIDFGNLTPEQQRTFQNLILMKRPPAAVTNVNVSNIEKGTAAELAKLVPDLADQANAAAGQLGDIPRYRAALNNAFVGPFANQRLAVARVANVLGFTGDKAINATTELIQGNAEMALKARGMLKGQGTITDTEQKLLLKARTGDINFTKGELTTLLDVFERASRAQYDKSVRLLRSAAGKSEAASMFLENVSPLPEAPTAPAPSPAAPAPAAAGARGAAPAMPSGFRVIR